MIRLIILFSLSLLGLTCFSQIDKTWMRYANPNDAGFSIDELNHAKDFFDSTNAVSLMLIKNGNVVVAWGDVKRRYKCHSIRKSLLNSLYGVGLKLNYIDIEKTIGELGIKEKVELLESEKSAKVKHLLSMSSGIYLDAALQPDVGGSPPRGSFKPGKNQYYNNWDFNVLGSIYNKESQSDIFSDFKKYIADPIGMQDYHLIDGTYEYEDISLHPGYPFKISTRDLVKFGQLYLQHGNWNGTQIFDTTWIAKSMTPLNKVDDTGNAATGYGYLWWIQEREGEPKRFFALGWGEQYLGVFPDEDMVIAINSNSYNGNYFIQEHREKLIKILLEANKSAQIAHAKLEPIEPIENKSIEIFLTKEKLSQYIGNYNINTNDFSEINSYFTIYMQGQELIVEGLHYAYKFKMIPVSNNKFFIEDIELFIEFEKDNVENNYKPILTKE